MKPAQGGVYTGGDDLGAQFCLERKNVNFRVQKKQWMCCFELCLMFEALVDEILDLDKQSEMTTK